MSSKQEVVVEATPCYKKKVGEEATLLESARDHFQQFKDTPADKHWICLKKKVRAAGEYVSLKTHGIPLFGTPKVGNMVDDGAKEAVKPAAVESH